jgi:hypothetical protein
MKRDLETIAIMFLESIKPISFVGSQLSMVFVMPFLSIFGDLGIDYIKFFEKRQNVEKLLKRLEEEVKVKDEERQKAKAQRKLVSETFGFQIDFSPGFILREDIGYTQPDSGVVGIAKKNSDGFIAISFAPIDPQPKDILNEVSTNINRDDVRRALALSPDMLLRKLESKQNVGKIKGHRISMETYEWNQQAEKGIVEGYGVWCDKTKRLFVLTLRTVALTEQKIEKNQIQELRNMLSSLRCH